MYLKVVWGNIDAVIKPYLWNTGPKMPALLSVENTGTGDVNITMPTAEQDLRPRAYSTNIIAQNGNITGNLIHGAETTLNAKNGFIDVTLLPHNVDSETRSVIRTESRYGDTRVRMLESVQGDAMKRTWSRHDVGGGTMAHCCEPGSLWLQYPADWFGTLDGRAKNGSIELQISENGGDLNLTGIKDDLVSPGFQSISASRGEGGSEVNFWVGNGQAEVLLGSS